MIYYNGKILRIIHSSTCEGYKYSSIYCYNFDISLSNLKGLNDIVDAIIIPSGPEDKKLDYNICFITDIIIPNFIKQT